MAPAITLTDWYGTVAYRDLSRRDLCVKVVAESETGADLEVRVVIRKTSTVFEGAWDKGLGEFRLFGPPSLDKAESAAVPEELQARFSAGIPSNWISLLKEMASRPSSFLSTLPPHPQPVASPSHSRLPPEKAQTCDEEPLTESLFDLGAGYRPDGRTQIRSIRQLAEKIRERKAKRGSRDDQGQTAPLRTRDEDYVRKHEGAPIAKEADTPGKEVDKNETTRGTGQLDADSEMHDLSDRSNAKADRHSPDASERNLELSPTSPNAVPVPETSPSNETTAPMSAPGAHVVDVGRSRSTSSTPTQIALASLVTAFFARGIPTLTATEGPYVSLVRDITEPVRTLLEAISVKIDLASSTSAPPRQSRIKKPTRPYELVLDAFAKGGAKATSPPNSQNVELSSAIESGSSTSHGTSLPLDGDTRVLGPRPLVEPGDEAAPVPEATVREEEPLGGYQAGSSKERNGSPPDLAVDPVAQIEGAAEQAVGDKTMTESHDLLRRDTAPSGTGQEKAAEGVGSNLLLPAAETALGAQGLNTTFENDSKRNEAIDAVMEDVTAEISASMDRQGVKVEEVVGPSMDDPPTQEAGGSNLELLDGGAVLFDDGDEESQDGDEDFGEDSKIFVKLSPRVTGEFDEVVPVRLDSSSPPPRLTSPPPPPQATNVEDDNAADKVPFVQSANVLPSPPDSPLRSTPEAALPPTPSFSDFYEDYDSENSIDTAAQEVAAFVEREAMGHSSDGFEEVISPSKRPLKTFEPAETIPEDPQVGPAPLLNGKPLHDSNLAVLDPSASEQATFAREDQQMDARQISSSDRDSKEPRDTVRQPSPNPPSPTLATCPVPQSVAFLPSNLPPDPTVASSIVAADGSEVQQTRANATVVVPPALERADVGVAPPIAAPSPSPPSVSASSLKIAAHTSSEVERPDASANIDQSASSTMHEALLEADELRLNESNSRAPAVVIAEKLEEAAQVPQKSSNHVEVALQEDRAESSQNGKAAEVPIEGTEQAGKAVELAGLEEVAHQSLDNGRQVRNGELQAHLDRSESTSACEEEETAQDLSEKRAAASVSGSGISQSKVKTKNDMATDATGPLFHDHELARDEEDQNEATKSEADETKATREEETGGAAAEELVQDHNSKSTTLEVNRDEEEDARIGIPGATAAERAEIEPPSFSAAGVHEVERDQPGLQDPQGEVKDQEEMPPSENAVEHTASVLRDESGEPSVLESALEVSLESIDEPLPRAPATSQAAEAAMRALRNEGTSPEPSPIKAEEVNIGKAFERGPADPGEEHLAGRVPNDGDNVPERSAAATVETDHRAKSVSPVAEEPVETIPAEKPVERARRTKPKTSRRPKSTFLGVEIIAKPVRMSKSSRRAPSAETRAEDQRSSPKLPPPETGACESPLHPRPSPRSLPFESKEEERGDPNRFTPPPPAPQPSSRRVPSQEFEGHSSSSEMRSPPPKRRKLGWRALQKQRSDAQAAAADFDVETRTLSDRSERHKGDTSQKEAIIRPRPRKSVGTHDSVLEEERDEDEIALSPAVAKRPARKRLAPSSGDKNASGSREVLRNGGEDPASRAAGITRNDSRPSSDSGHGSVTPEVDSSRQRRLSTTGRPRDHSLKKPRTSSQTDRRRSFDEVDSPKASFDRSTPKETPREGSRRALRNSKQAKTGAKRNEAFERETDAEMGDDEVGSITTKRQGKTNKLKGQSRTFSDSEDEEASIEQPRPERKLKRKKRQAPEEEEEEEDEMRSPSYDHDVHHRDSESDEEGPLAKFRPSGSKTDSKAKAPPKRRRKRKSIVMPRTKKRPNTTPQASASKSKSVAEDPSEKLSRASGVKKRRKRQAQGEKDSVSPSKKKRKTFAESDSDDDDEWRG